MSTVKALVDWFEKTDWLATTSLVAAGAATASGVLDLVMASFNLPDAVVPALLVVAAALGASKLYLQGFKIQLEADHDGDGLPMAQDRDEQIEYLRNGLKRALDEAMRDRDGDGVPTFRDPEDSKAFFLEMINYRPASDDAGAPEPEGSDPSD